MTPRGGKREGAGRPPRQEPKSRAIWCGQMPEEHRALILERLTPDERHEALLDAATLKGDRRMITVTVRREDNNGREFGYGVYVNAYVTWDDIPNDSPMLYASECVPFGKNDEKNLKAAEKRVKAKAQRIAKKEYVG